jgi:hypothetical protein
MIDWLAVSMVCEGTPLKLTMMERRMAMRRLSERMLTRHDGPYSAGKLSGEEVARRLQLDQRSVVRLNTNLRPATKTQCAVCREPMWVVNGVVEPHPDRLLNECPMSNQRTRSGLAAIRPDLYAWADEGVSA